jgi:signal transduction histidine kinase
VDKGTQDPLHLVSLGARPPARALFIQLGELGTSAQSVLGAVEFDALSEVSLATPVIGVCSDTDSQWPQLCAEFKTSLPHGVFILINTSDRTDVIRQGVDIRVDFFLRPGGLDSSQGLLARARDRALLQVQQQGRLRRGSEEIREFNRRREDLEKIVSERASNIKESVEEQELRLHKIRSLIRWIRELAVASSIEDVLVLMKSEFRSVHAVVDIMVLVELGPQQRLLHRLVRGQIQSLKGPQVTPVKNEWSQFLADICQRPVGKIATVELDTPLIRRLGFPEARVYLLFENSLIAREKKLFFDEHAERVSSLSITVDRILLEEELTRYSYRWEKTFDGLREPLTIIDTDFRVIRSNLAFSDRSRAGSCYQLFQNSDETCVGCPVQEAAASQTPQRGEVRRGDKTFEVHTFPIFLGQSTRPSNFVNLYVDITDQRSLTQRYIQSEKLSALGLLAGNIAHELNNPLTGLRSMAQLLVREVPADSQLQLDLLEVEKATARSEKIIQHLLEFTDFESRELSWESMDEVLQKTLPLLKMTMRLHQVTIRMNAGSRRVFVQTHLLQQVIFNIVSNACQAMIEPGQVNIETDFDPASGLVSLKIQDTGPGIAPELHAKVFEPFFTTKEEGKGTGLGLSLSREIIEKFKGSIRMRSELGIGTSFTIELPGEK